MRIEHMHEYLVSTIGGSHIVYVSSMVHVSSWEFEVYAIEVRT